MLKRKVALLFSKLDDQAEITLDTIENMLLTPIISRASAEDPADKRIRRSINQHGYQPKRQFRPIKQDVEFSQDLKKELS